MAITYLLLSLLLSLSLGDPFTSMRQIPPLPNSRPRRGKVTIPCVDCDRRSPKVPTPLPAGSACTDTSICISGTTCRKSLCTTDLPLGATCNKTATAAHPSLCERRLQCKNSRCVGGKLKRKDSCVAPGAICSGELVCAEVEESGRVCAVVGDAGSKCGSKARVCADSLVCVNGKCESGLVGEGGDCNKEINKCEVGLVCAGREGLKKCVKPVPVGEGCGFDPYVVCEEGDFCRGGTCFDADVAQGGVCGRKGLVCQTGLVCDKGICAQEVRIGEQCNSMEGTACATGIPCTEGICTAPIVAQGQSCEVMGSVCESGLVCAGRPGGRRCEMPVAAGKMCDVDLYRDCGQGAVCFEGICRLLKGKYEFCGREELFCGWGFKCVWRYVRFEDVVFDGGNGIGDTISYLPVCVKSDFW